MPQKKAKQTPYNAISTQTNANAQPQQESAGECVSAPFLKEETYYAVTQTTYTCGMLADGALGVYKSEADIGVFQTESEAFKLVFGAIVKMFAAYNVKDWESHVIEDKSEIQPDDFGYIVTKSENETTYNMWDTRGKYPCDFTDFHIVKKTFYCARAKVATNEKIKTDFDVDYFFKDEKLSNEIDERKKTLEEFNKLLGKQ